MVRSMGIRIVPLGGLGEIGMNCMAIELGAPDRGPIVVVDCGISFPNEDNGVDVIHPDFTWLQARADRVQALVITHGHEDHIGAIPYLLQRFDVPVYGPPYALGLVRTRLQEHRERILRDPKLLPTRPRQPFYLADGAIEVEPIRVTHSIADATALAIRHEGECIVHTGDFKIDADPTDRELFDLERLKEIGDDGVSLLLSDSTNIDSPGTARGERRVADALARLIEGARQRVIVGLFASNAHRVRALLEIARRCGRKVALLGRSVQLHVRVAQETGYLTVPSDLLVSFDDAASVPRDRLLVIATGSQAEPRAALARLALDDHPKLRLEPGDTAILSSRAIPGNEVGVMRMVADLYRRGCIVHLSSTDPEIHASGHAHRDEQRAMIDLVRPAAFVPVHGTRHHLERHAALARDAGVGDVLVIENGELAEVDDAGVRKVDTFRVGRIAVDSAGELADATLRERGALGELGVVAVSVTVDARGRPAGPVAIASRGVLDEATRPHVIEAAKRDVHDALRTWPWSSERPTDDEVREVARLAVRRSLARATQTKPVAIPLLVRRNED
jgi:ribonuclease J